ncbi:MAG: hypothetical protein KAV87_48200, partial [Desulfobacteraceae bacterium]|nr:hypothetical protein [Desulfobacteraceae bacterium]
DNIRYCPEMVGWYIWNGQIWNLDTAGQINQLAKSMTVELWDRAQHITDLDQKKKMVNFAISCENQSKIKSMVESAQNEPGIPISINEFDKNRDVLCVGNGIVDLRTLVLSEFDKSEYITKQIPTKYNPSASCPRFDTFLNEIFAGDQELVGFMKRYLGYSITGNTNEQVFVLLEGSGANGKGTLIDTVMEVMADYAKTTAPETIIQKKYERSSTNDLAALKGARFVTTSENEANQVLDEGRIKRITGQDKIACRFLYREFFEYIPEYKLALLTNHDIIIKAQDYSIWRRILKLHFPVTFEKGKSDKNLRDELLKEKEGILHWLIEGAKEWYDVGLIVPESIKLTTQEYKEELDTEGDFVELFCVVDDGVSVASGDLYTLYKSWCEVTNIFPKGTRSFARELSDRNFKSNKKNGVRYKIGIDLKEIHKLSLAEARLFEDEKALSRALGSYIRQFLVSAIGELNNKSLQKDQCDDPSTSLDSGRENDKRPRMRKEGTHSQNTTISPQKKAICDKCGQEQLIEDLEDGPMGLQKICRMCQAKIINESKNNKFNILSDNSSSPENNSNTIKIKLDIPASDFTFNGVQYSLKRGDIADIPADKARDMIGMGKAVEVSEVPA